jgi:hypothetical protein
LASSSASLCNLSSSTLYTALVVAATAS